MADNSLEAFVENVCGDSHLRVEADLGDGYVRLKSAEAERRQAAHDIRSTEDVVIELLRNARDAHAQSIFLAVTREGSCRKLVMIDDGDGVPLTMHDHIFEPRVTSKLDSVHMDKWGVHGRGMALYSIAANADVARIAASDTRKGSSFVIETNLDTLGEKVDQSSFPVFEQADTGKVVVRGPRNILRTSCEFAIECRHDCTVYVGSATDVAATLYAFGLSSLTSAARVFCSDPSELPICKRLSVSSDPASFSDQAALLGLVISERSARRIMDGEIAPLSPLLNRIRLREDDNDSGVEAKPASKRTDAQAAQSPCIDARGLKVSSGDVTEFADRVQSAFFELARDYYLKPDVKPEVRVGKDAIHITIPVEKQR